MADGFEACFLCGCTETRYWFRPDRSPGPIVQCLHCGLVYVGRLEDRHALISDGPVLGRYPPEWLESSDVELLQKCWELPLIQAAENELLGKTANANHFLHLIEQYCPKRGRLLDVGAFCGIFLNTARERGWDVVGLEPLVGPSIYARGKFGIEMITDVLSDSTFPGESFDVVTAFQVLEHLPNPVKAVGIMQRLLKPGGLLVIEVPSIEHWSIRLLRKHHRHFVPDHLFFFAPRTLTQLLASQGFDKIKVTNSRRSLSIAALLEWLPRLLHVFEADRRRWFGKQSWLRRRIITVKTSDIIATFAFKPG